MKINFLLQFIIIVSFFLQALSIDIGFFLKPYMVLSIFFISNILKIKKYYIYEIILFSFYFLYSLTAFFALDKVESFRMLGGFLIYSCCYFLYRNFFKEKRISYDVIFYSGVFFNTLSLIYYFIGVLNLNQDISFISYGLMFDRGMYRLRGIVNNPDYFNVFNIFFITYSLRFKNKRNRYLLLFSFFMSLLTFSLTAIFIIFIIFIIDIILFENKKDRRKVIKNLILFIFCIIFIVFLVFDIDLIKNIFQSRITHITTGSGRYKIWGFAIDIFKKNTLFGIGLNNLRGLIRDEFNKDNVHNTYLEIFTESGIFIGSLFIIFIFSYFKMLSNYIWKNNKAKFIFLSSFALFLSMFFIPCLIHEIFLLTLLFNINMIAFSIESECL